MNINDMIDYILEGNTLKQTSIKFGYSLSTISRNIIKLVGKERYKEIMKASKSIRSPTAKINDMIDYILEGNTLKQTGIKFGYPLGGIKYKCLKLVGEERYKEIMKISQSVRPSDEIIDLEDHAIKQADIKFGHSLSNIKNRCLKFVKKLSHILPRF